MHIRELGIENFRRFRKPLRLAGFEDGLNLVCEPNETGKSTVLEAMRAVLFERHGSRSDRIQSFRPHGDEVAPEVEMVFSVDAETWRVKKRFLQRPEAVLEGPDGRSTGDEAEEKLQALLGFSRAGNRGADAESRGALGLLWVEQGQSFVLGAPGQTARRTLQEVLAGEVGTITGGRRTVMVVQAVERALGELLTPTGRPTGRLLRAQNAAESAEAEAAAAADELQQFEAVLERLEVKRNELRRLLGDLADPEAEAQLAALGADISRAESASQALNTAEVIFREAEGARQRLEERGAARMALRKALIAAETDAAKASAAASAHAEDVERARHAEKVASEQLDQARIRLRDADEARRAAIAAKDVETHERAMAAAFGRLHVAEPIAEKLEASRRILAESTMTEDRASKLEVLERQLVEAHAVATAGAASLRVALELGAPEVRLNDALIVSRAEVAVTIAQVIEFTGVGTVRVEPPIGREAAQRALHAAERNLEDFLADAGFDSAAEARAASRSRTQAEQTTEGLAARLAAACPADSALKIGSGLEALRGALVAQSRPTTPSSTEVVAEDLETKWEAVRTEERGAEGRREGALDALHTAEREEVRLAGVVERLAMERDRLTADIAAETGAFSDEQFITDLQAAKATEARALIDRDQARRAVEGLDPVQLGRRRDGLLQRRKRMGEDRLELVQEIAKLEERAKTLGGTGPTSRAAAGAEVAEAARAALLRLQDDAETLNLLDSVIKDAQQDASRRFLAPITQRVGPYITRLLPSASLAFGEDYAPQRLIRGGREEAAEHLSKGTQEQLAVLTRIAFADLLIEKGKPASLVLDDALVFADDDRFETMLDILADAAQRMQVIILSCRTSAYRGLPATRIVID